MENTAQYLFARVSGFECDVEALRHHYLETVSKFRSTNYRDNRVDYVGWAVTSRDGSLDDGVQRISTKNSPDRKQNRLRGKTRTDICTGALATAMDALGDCGFTPYRARVMSLMNEGEVMPFHTDATTETWRLHVPIITNDHCFFEWERDDGMIDSVHLPADGSAWLVRVDIRHRAVNRSNAPSNRVHLLMGLNELPPIQALGSPRILI